LFDVFTIIVGRLFLITLQYNYCDRRAHKMWLRWRSGVPADWCCEARSILPV